ncbi:MAG TPA: hypothetical protein VN661_00880, partial [Candidatus Acidoferrales bacterium]|nr:hypothetical protein [Candidatus Acidoferrales bacterium]
GFAHDADGFREGDDDFLVVVNVAGGKLAAFAVLEPFFADLIAADLESPDVFRDSFKELGCIYVDAAERDFRGAICLDVADLLDFVIGGLFIASDDGDPRLRRAGAPANGGQTRRIASA